MKTILTLLILSSAQLLAAGGTFQTQEEGVFRTSSQYKLASSIELDVKSVLTIETLPAQYEVSLVLNGSEAKLPAELVYVDYDGTERTESFKLVLKSDTLSSGGCEEYEQVQYVARFDVRSELGHYVVVENVELAAVAKYTYDNCHSPISYTTYPYDKQ